MLKFGANISTANDSIVYLVVKKFNYFNMEDGWSSDKYILMMREKKITFGIKIHDSEGKGRLFERTKGIFLLRSRGKYWISCTFPTDVFRSGGNILLVVRNPIDVTV